MITKFVLPILVTFLSLPATCVGQGGITLIAQKMQADPGEEVCMSISASDFQNMLSMQYSLRWDPQVLSFRGIKNFNLPWLGQENFGTHRAGEGILSVVWIDNSLQGVSKENGNALFELCFQVKGSSGSETPIRFVEQPTPFEAVNLQEQVVGINTVEGRIRVE
ncbi:MAG: cohesin domain-containing protein [Saprospiraceae bacterium]|nr:cohesin domain-containing protein [Saprospiraceae bacterium]